jgi:hypothetical protein
VGMAAPDQAAACQQQALGQARHKPHCAQPQQADSVR